MRKVTAIVLLLLLASTNEVGQILKLPLLITHYIDHYREERQSVAAYFHEHYVHHHKNNNRDEDEDNRLPFKTTNIQQISFTYVMPAREAFEKHLPFLKEETPTLPFTFINSDFLKDIFHPPQIA